MKTKDYYFGILIFLMMLAYPTISYGQDTDPEKQKEIFQQQVDEINKSWFNIPINYGKIERLAKEGYKEAQDFLKNPEKYLTPRGLNNAERGGRYKKKPSFTTPERMGFTLTRSTTIDGIKCDHYEKEGKEYRTFKKNNGDFMTFTEDPDGFNNAPSEKENSIGFYRMTTNDNVVLTNDNEYGEVKVTLKNGNVIKMKTMTFNWEIFTKDFSFYNSFRLTWKPRIEEIYLADNPNKKYSVSNGTFSTGSLKYRIDDEGNCKAFMKSVKLEGTNDNIDVYTSGDVEITSAKKTETGKEITFANGDKIVLVTTGTPPLHTYDLLGEGTVVHKKNGLFKIKNGKMNFTMNDGSIFVGFFKEQIENGSYDAEAKPMILQFDELTPWDGKIQLADGTMDEMQSGQSKAGLVKAQKAEETKIINEIKAKINKLGQKYGAANVNYMKTEGVVKVGFSVAMIQEYVTLYEEYEKRGLTGIRPQDCYIGEIRPTQKDILQFGGTVKKYQIVYSGLVVSTFLAKNGKVVMTLGIQSHHLIDMKKLN